MHLAYFGPGIQSLNGGREGGRGGEEF